VARLQEKGGNAVSPFPRRPRIELSLDNVLHNLSAIRSRLPHGVGVLAVVKDGAYGCGSRLIAKTLEREGGVSFFAVGNPAEAFFLRRGGLASPLLVFGAASPAEIRKGSALGIVFTMNDIGDLDRWKAAGTAVRFHCNIDTGMHRLGILPSETARLADALAGQDTLRFEGAFTHLANADEPGASSVHRQLRLFRESLSLLTWRGLAPRHVHYANSAAILRFDLPGCTLVRPGIALYGCRPDPAQDFGLDLRPVASFTASVVKTKRVPPGAAVSYGGRYVTDRETCIATINAGYGHGIPRSLSGRGNVLIRGKRHPIAGRITMDYLMVDAGPDPLVRAGDEAVVMGCQEDACISADEIAILDNTISYEILCRMGASLDRVYYRGEKVVSREKGLIR
jgi:alanine racemase